LDSGYYAACSALKTQTNALDIAANNIANVSTAGYRGQIPSFQALLVQTAGPQMGGWEHLVNEHAVLNGSRLDLAQGNLEHTGNPMNFAIEGPGFFAVQTKAGAMYTRKGSFQVSASGQLVSAAGDPVLGVSGPITVPGGAVSISQDGTVSVGGGVAGKLRIAEFASANALTPAGSSYYSAPKGAEKSAIASSVRQGMLESSNVSPISAMVGLISAQRQAEMIERAMSAFDSTFNRIAADELPRTT
jgi:flagellar basal-body rod protein FlgF/flagellar basal-body rod protein FlgG